MHVIYAGLAILSLCSIFKSVELTGEDLATECVCVCVYTCKTFIGLFYSIVYNFLASVTLHVYILWIAFCQVCLIPASVFLLTFLPWNKGLNGLKFSWAEGKMNWVLVEFFISSQRPQFCQEWNSKKLRDFFLQCFDSIVQKTKFFEG